VVEVEECLMEEEVVVEQVDIDKIIQVLQLQDCQ
jgi:hypothetical protein